MSTLSEQRERERRPYSLVGVVTAALLTVAALVMAWQAVVGPDPSTAAAPAGATPHDRSTFERRFEDDEAFADAPWAKDLRVNLLDAWENLEFNGATGWRIKDSDTEYIDVQDGERRSVEPDPALGKPIEVWFFGGSAAFGAGQRDEHTIPSELVRMAGAEGVPLKVRNFGVPATVNWQSAMLLIEKLAWDQPPDLILFYEGANDLNLQDTLATSGKGQSDRPASLIDGELDRILRERAKSAGVDDAVGATTVTSSAPLDPSTSGTKVLTRYSHGVEVARRAAAEAGVPIAFFWQPQLTLKEPLTDSDRVTLGQVGYDDQGVARSRAQADQVLAGLPALGVTDLTAVFDARTDAIYWDTVHTNEKGATLVAAAIYADIRPTVADLRGAD